jgi:D-serine deaminase-like pyridoxal phosphate-dependent protein
MSDDYLIRRPEQLLSPSLVVFRPLVERNLATMLRIAGSADRLRPHCKTHKMPAVVKMLLAAGIRRHKAATIAEVEMLADCGVRDVVLAYNPVGPNIGRVVGLKKLFPDLKLGVTADHPVPLGQLSEAIGAAGMTIDVYLDLNPGRDRTGLIAGDEAFEFYRTIASTPHVRAAGFHIYDGHFHQADPKERLAALLEKFRPIQAMRDRLEKAGAAVPKMICGGTPSFPVYATIDDPAIELSPGTCIFHDANYGEKFPDLEVFKPAALLFTRVVSRPKGDRVTLDLGSKSVASDPPMGQRVVFPKMPQGSQVLHNEEHLVVETPNADEFAPGDWQLGVPRHVCPCSALHKEAYVIADGDLVGTWPVVGRDRKLTV